MICICFFVPKSYFTPFDIQAQPYLQARLQGRRQRLLRERFGAPKQGA
jgi:hypothetical protein